MLQTPNFQERLTLWVNKLWEPRTEAKFGRPQPKTEVFQHCGDHHSSSQGQYAMLKIQSMFDHTTGQQGINRKINQN
jgi:hypothetical protein